MILGLDPGNTRSALVALDGTRVAFAHLLENGEMLAWLERYQFAPIDMLVIERVESFGMAVGAEVFETVFWSGRFAEAWAQRACRWDRLTRRDVKLHLCRTSRAKDANIRQALIDRYGGKDAAIGRKAMPGPLYGLKADLWAALAVAVTYADTRAQEAA